ncbi:MAG: lactonase family protein [Chlorobi bacterium]|nr:lactonase family protein [Chlorobiota bacterium]
MTRTLFLISTVLLFTVSCRQQPVTKSLFVGTYTNKGGDGVMTYSFNTGTGELNKARLAVKLSNPSYVAVSHDGSRLYAVSEKDDSKVSVFNITEDGTNLEPVSSKKLNAAAACYVSSNKDDSELFVANYVSGTFSFLPLDPNGKILSVDNLKPGVASKVDTTRQMAPHAHSIAPGPFGKYVYGADLGADRIFVFTKNNDKYVLYKEVVMPPGSGPRHFAFHPDGETMAVLGELNSTVIIVKKDYEGCFSKVGKSYSMLPEGFTGFSKAADIHFSPDGNFLYASNRGHNSIVVYDFRTGAPKPVQWVTEKIKWPRNFTIDPSGNFLIVANRHSNSITVFKRDTKTGKLTYLSNSGGIFEPVCLKFR